MTNLSLAGLYYYPCQRKFNYYKWLAIIGWLLFFLMLGLYFFPDLEASSEIQWEDFSDEKIVSAIWYAEGGYKSKFPYGIKSINTKGNKEYARQICLNSVRNGRGRWIKASKPYDLIVYIGLRYCPPQAHKLNSNWVRNVKFFLLQK